MRERARACASTRGAMGYGTVLAWNYWSGGRQHAGPVPTPLLIGVMQCCILSATLLYNCLGRMDGIL